MIVPNNITWEDLTEGVEYLGIRDDSSGKYTYIIFDVDDIVENDNSNEDSWGAKNHARFNLRKTSGDIIRHVSKEIFEETFETALYFTVADIITIFGEEAVFQAKLSSDFREIIDELGEKVFP